MDHPVDLTQLPEAARKALGGPAPLKMMVARGMAPLPPAALVSALYGLAWSRDDEKLKEAAEKTLGALPDAVLNGALGTPDLHPAVLDDLVGRFRANRAVPLRVRINTGSHIWLIKSPNLAILQGASTYSEEKRPVTLTPNHENASHIAINATKKVGVAMPM